MVNIAVLGYGTVGSGVVEVINTNHKSINKRAGAEINVKYVLDLRDFPGDPDVYKRQGYTCNCYLCVFRWCIYAA